MAGPSCSLEAGPGEPFAAHPGHVILSVRITPKASRSTVGAVLALGDGRAALAVRIAAPPVEGAANAALVVLLAKTLGLKRGDIAIVAGETGRLKRVAIAGDVPDILARLRAVIAEA